jgi:SAM-dependent methyltransferase
MCTQFPSVAPEPLTSPSDSAASGDDGARTGEAFGERILRALNESAMIQLLSIGHRTGLLETLGRSGAVTSEELAREAGLSERYVREWLGGMAAAKVLELTDEGRFRLPPAYAALLTSGGTENVAVFAQYAPVLGSVEDDIVRCFREGGGVPYSRFERFHEIMADDSGQTVLGALHSHILPLVPGLTARLQGGIRMLDLGCGRGRAIVDLAEHFPASDFIGYDLSEEAVDYARTQASAKGLTNIRFESLDLTDFDERAEPEAFDFVTTFDAVHDQARPARLLRGIARTLRPDGVYLMQDIRAESDVRGNLEHPMGPFLYTISLMHCMTVSLAQGGDGLGTMWGRQLALSMLRDAGFGEVQIHQLDHDFQNDYYVVRPAERA